MLLLSAAFSLSLHSAMNHPHGEGLLAAGVAPAKAPVQVKGHPGQVSHVLQQGKEGEILKAAIPYALTYVLITGIIVYIFS